MDDELLLEPLPTVTDEPAPTPGDTVVLPLSPPGPFVIASLPLLRWGRRRVTAFSRWSRNLLARSPKDVS